VNLLWFRT